MDDYDVIYLDDDERNARPQHNDNRRRVVGGGRRPGGSSVVVPPSRRPTVIHSGGRSGGGVSRREVVVQESAPSKFGIGGLTTGELIEVAAQILAAIQPLPGAPVAQGEVETDVENLVIYQTALATHAKRDEQLRTLGGLIGKLLK